ncbi:hypothetical protein [Leifsonia sp. 71-9]|uniref:hypothetical protein n=1 Tax=Leifsonia sp. 71-9 TaxID=1895934 RepID=UPI0009275F8C|nr:hypothetical protein [Leifsonia sp. 71-9]OJX75388.1 MAG: hypothetical protein BGO91_19015 [Leifsonia sp. 71-9]
MIETEILSSEELRIRAELSDASAGWPLTATQLDHAHTVLSKYGSLSPRLLRARAVRTELYGERRAAWFIRIADQLDARGYAYFGDTPLQEFYAIAHERFE